MKRIFLFMICALCTFSLASGQSSKKKDTKETTKFLVTNMECENCVKKIEKNIAFEKGVTDLKCDLKTHTVEVTYNTEKTTEKKLIAAFKKINYNAEVEKVEKR